MKQMKKTVAACLTLAAMIVSVIPARSEYELPHAFWAMNDKYEAAVKSNNYSDTIIYGNQIIDLMMGEPDTSDKRNILVSRYNEVGKAYASMGEYDKSAEVFKTFYNYVSPLGSEYYDYIKVSKAKLEQYETQMDIYTDGGTPVYYGAKNEKRNGVLFGLCATSETCDEIDNESMVLIYQEFGESLWTYNTAKVKDASERGIAVEFALNCPKKVKDIKNTEKMSSYLSEISDLFKTYNNTPIYLRFAAEFDIWDTVPDADDYVKAFRYVSNYFKSRNPNVAMVWSPNQVSNWDLDLDDYYPGDSYVDWVGLSSYAQRYFLGSKNQDEVNEIVFKSGVNSEPVIAVKDIVDKYGDRKPIMLSECGCGHRLAKSGEDVSSFALTRLKQYYSYLPMVYPQIKLMAYFDQYVDSELEMNDYRLTNNSAMLREFKRLTKGERFIQDAYSNDSSLCYRKVDDGTRLDGTFLLSCYAHKYNNDTQKVTYFIDDKYVGMSEEFPFSTYVNAADYTGTHILKAVAQFADGSTLAREKEVSINGSGRDITVRISGGRVNFDQQPVIYNSRTMVPMRKIFEEIGADVSWDGDTKTATGTRGDRTVKLSAGSSKMYINHKQVLLDTPPIILGGRTLVPARAVAEGMGCTVDWDESSYLVSITPRVFEWSDWDTSLPSEVDSDLFYIENRDEYRTRTRTRTKDYYTSDRRLLSGNYVRTDTSYGSWGDWQDEYISSNENREVDTRTVSEPVQYRYYHYCTGYNDDPDYSFKTSSGKFCDWATYEVLGTYDYQLPYAPDGNGGQVYYYEDGTMLRCENSCYRWYEERIGGDYTQYRSRPIYYEYVYWQWSDWSDWSRWSSWQTGSVPSRYGLGEDEDMDTDSRTVYRYKEK